ncbi:MAG: DUF6298 domain-containing protein [Bacteroidales bacterium]|jgi:hypothetical protein|nr:DUF6298 domain-containing protein [Bacteroidales bacterium]
MKKFLILSLIVLLSQKGIFAQSLTITSEKKLEYRTFENGDRIPDYSFCGFLASEQPIPLIPTKVTVAVQDGDATARIQRAIDYVSSLSMDTAGFRGAVQLQKGVYRLNGSLRIEASGVIVRGSGYGEDGTVLIASGTSRETLIQITGKNDKTLSDSIPLTGNYVPLNAVKLPVAEGHPLKVGDRIVITRPSTEEWLTFIGADKVGGYVDYPLTTWAAGDFDLQFERTITAVSSTSVTIDVPLTNSLDAKFGMGYISRLQWSGRISNVGVENLRCVSEYDESNSKDEHHRWMAITVENAQDGWVRRVTGEHFVSSIVALWESVRRFTVEDCRCLNPVGEIGGYRRYAFQTSGQQTLFQRCYAEYGYHDFSVGFSTAGPNAFVQCYSYRPYDFSGALGGWSCGTLFDRLTVDGAALKITFRDVDGQGGGWSAANSLCWECRVPQLHLMSPPGAYNWAFGTWGQGYGNGSHEMPRKFLKPKTFYYAQWEARTGRKSEEFNNIYSLHDLPLGQTDPTYTALMSKRSEQPELITNQWIDTIATRYPLALDVAGVPEINAVKWSPKADQSTPVSKQPITVQNGQLLSNNGTPLIGHYQRTALWKGSTRPSVIRSAGLHLSRFVPGRTGKGFTDNLDSVAAEMQQQNIAALNHFPALWYERRRDDHGRSRRVDADVWAPFYEQPFSRSGQGEAFDRLSKYDLNRWNTWYWMRLKQFADIADQKGLLFVQDHYLQHNIIEEGAHWADYPWRTANNINELSFPENVYYAGDKRVFMADQFYDITNERLVNYHRQNIRKHLDELGENTNVVHHLGMEYTGPAHFVKFWLDVINEWEQETGKDVKVMFSATKDVEDTILQHEHYRKLVDIIEINQWHYRTDGSLYAPDGGVSLAARQYVRIIEPDTDNFDGVFRAVNDYKTQYPEKVVVYRYGRNPGNAWISFLAGGSLCNLPNTADERLYHEAAQMTSHLSQKDNYWGMYKPSTGYIVYLKSNQMELDLTADKTNYTLRWLTPQGEIIGKPTKISGGKPIQLNKPVPDDAVMWLSKK